MGISSIHNSATTLQMVLRGGGHENLRNDVLYSRCGGDRCGGNKNVSIIIHYI